MNGLRSHIKNSKECFIRYPNTSKSVKKTRLRLVFSTHFSGFGYPDETLFLVFDILHKVGRLLFSQNNNAVFHPTQSISGLSAARFFLFYLSYAQSHNHFPAKYVYCEVFVLRLELVNLFYWCWKNNATPINTIVNWVRTWSVWIFSFWWGRHS